ncbi:MAG: hypothetical protein ACRCXQ_13855 [Vagococcus fluvialis]
MSVFDDLEVKKEELKDLSIELEKVISNLELIDNDMAIREVMETVENAITELKDINTGIY